MALAEIFGIYLQDHHDPGARETLAAALEAAGYALEGSLLRRYFEHGPGTTTIGPEGGVWQGRRVHLSLRPPTDTRPGEVWFDVLELVSMLLLPDEPLDPGDRYDPRVIQKWRSDHAWFGLRPVANWQYRAFLALAPRGSQTVQISPPFKLLDPERITAGAETDLATSLTANEARMYAGWFGKGIGDHFEWELAHTVLSDRERAALWAGSKREWAGEVSEGEEWAVGPDTVRLQPLDIPSALVDDEDLAPRKIYSEWSHPTGVTFRTCVLTQLGLVTELGPNTLSLDDVHITKPLNRDV